MLWKLFGNKSNDYFSGRNDSAVRKIDGEPTPRGQDLLARGYSIIRWHVGWGWDHTVVDATQRFAGYSRVARAGAEAEQF